MDTLNITRQKITYSKIYWTDIFILVDQYKNIKGLKKIDTDFGLPFLQFNKENKLLGFASLIINKNQKIDFEISYFDNVFEEDQQEIKLTLQNYLNNEKSENFTNIDQLRASIDNLIFWMNS